MRRILCLRLVVSMMITSSLDIRMDCMFGGFVGLLVLPKPPIRVVDGRAVTGSMQGVLAFSKINWAIFCPV